VAANSSAGVTPAASATAAVSGADTQETTCRIDLIRSRRPLCHDTLPPGVEGPLLALIPAGSFDMGSTAAPEEQPVHHVTIQEPFAISVYEVSQGEFKHYCEQAKRPCAPQPWAGDDYPVVNVSWDDARAYTEWLSGVTHHRYSLPTEAQWEYAARAGRTGLFPNGDALSATDAQFSGLTKQTAAARRSQSFNANAFRLLHTVGNVREWVEDSWIQNFVGAPSDGSAVKPAQAGMHVARGGSYTDGATRLRLSMREGLPINTRDVTTGFRIVRELP
jgi:serine/threonine-protein kinase PpkA